MVSRLDRVNEEMRVGLSTATISPGRARDGIGVYTAALAHTLPNAGVSVKGFVLGERGAVLPGTSRLASSYLSHVARDFVGLRKPLALDVDVVHFTDYHIVPTRVPSVATLHDAVPLKYPEWVSPRLRSVKNHVLKRMARHADHVIAISAFAVDELVEYFGVARDRIHIVPCGIDADWLIEAAAPPAKVDPVNVPGVGQVSDYFLFVGTFQPRKNLDRVLDAYAMLPAATQKAHPLLVVGRAGWRCDHTVARLQALRADGASVYWLARVDSREQLRAIYRGALALVFASLYEGFGLPVLEGFASGVPVLASTASSVPEVAGPAALLVNPYQAEAISDAMLRLADDDNLRRELVALGQARVTTFTWDETARKLADLYASIR